MDFKAEVGFCSHWQIAKMFSRFYPETPDAQANLFADKAVDLSHPVSPAMIQGFFMYHKVNTFFTKSSNEVT